MELTHEQQNIKRVDNCPICGKGKVMLKDNPHYTHNFLDGVVALPLIGNCNRCGKIVETR